jgi:hypothetical protein
MCQQHQYGLAEHRTCPNKKPKSPETSRARLAHDVWSRHLHGPNFSSIACSLFCKNDLRRNKLQLDRDAGRQLARDWIDRNDEMIHV